MIWTIPGRLKRGRRLPMLSRWHGTLTGASPLDDTPSGSERRTAPAQQQHAEAREATFEQFFHAHEGTILGYLWRITGDEQASHDIAQETFLRAWQRFEQVSHYEQPRAWLFRVATNLASNHRRHRSIHDATMAHISPTHPATLDPAAGIAESAVVRAALLAMPVRQRSALVLRVVYGLSIAEIAEALGASKAAAAMTLSRAREAFRAQYAQEESR
jgi:RNA polymerase sigma-70 factor (ECF subfamily)